MDAGDLDGSERDLQEVSDPPAEVRGRRYSESG